MYTFWKMAQPSPIPQAGWGDANYDGSISDKKTVTRSGIMGQWFWEDGDSCMADRGFTIADDLKA